jgi:pimeloyl-ACP methyl ester carboxylesterase
VGQKSKFNPNCFILRKDIFFVMSQLNTFKASYGTNNPVRSFYRSARNALTYILAPQKAGLPNALPELLSPEFSAQEHSSASQFISGSLSDRIGAEQRQRDIGFSTALKEKLRTRHLVLVNGFGGDAVPGGIYFRDFVAEAKRLGMKISQLSPKSWRSVPDNARELYQDLIGLYEASGKPIILIGHSKGGAAIEDLLKRHPELLVLKIVERAGLINPALRGTILAQDETYIQTPITEHIRSRINQGYKSLRPKTAQRNRKQARRVFNKFMRKHFGDMSAGHYQENLANISQQVLSVSSTLPLGTKASWILRLHSLLLKNGLPTDIPNDCVLAQDSQKMNLEEHSLGVDLPTLEGDHIEYVISFFSRSNSKKRKAFARAFLQALYVNETV